MNSSRMTRRSEKPIIWNGVCGHTWTGTPKNRSNGHGCPVCSGNKIIAGINDFSTLFPKISNEWANRNFPDEPQNFGAHSNRSFWWKCSFCGREWKARIADRSEGHGCPYSDPELIHLALEDNLYRDRFDLKYVDETLNSWKEQGITDLRAAKNNILDNHVRNVSYMAGEIARQRYNDDLAESIVQRNPATDLQGTRDYMVELYRTGRYDALLSMADITYHKDILDYLPQEIVDFINSKKH